MLCDTNILIAYLNGEAVVFAFLSRWQQERRTLYISVATVVELFAHPLITKEEGLRIETFLTFFTIIPFDIELAKRTAFLKRNYRLSFPDAVITGTAWGKELSLITRDRQLFKVKEVVVRSL